MQRKTTVILAICWICAGTVGGVAHAADWWVDSLGAGDGSDSSTPMPNLQAAIDAASPNDTIHIRGAAGRTYTTNAFPLVNNEWLINKSGLTLQDWEGKPRFSIVGGSATVRNRVVNIATNNVTLRNLRFEVKGAVLGQNDDLVEITPTTAAGTRNITIEGCEFIMIPQYGGHWGAGSPCMQAGSLGSNIVVRNCFFGDWDYGDGYRFVMVSLNAPYCKVISNTFSNTSRCVGGVMNYSTISSNRIINCVNTRVRPAPNKNLNAYMGAVAAAYQGMRYSEISYNIMWNNNGKRTSFLDKTRDGFTGSGTMRIFNNTIYNTYGFSSSEYYSNADRWSPLIYNNLMLSSSYTNIFSVTNTASTGTNTFLATSQIKNNMWYGGPASLTDPKSVFVTPPNLANNYYVNCSLLNTTDPNDPDFMRPDAGATPEILQGIGGAYPGYIGAVQPKPRSPSGTVVLLL